MDMKGWRDSEEYQVIAKVVLTCKEGENQPLCDDQMTNLGFMIYRWLGECGGNVFVKFFHLLRVKN